MEPQSSLPYSQAPATCPYPEPDRSSPYPPSHFMQILLNIILQSTSWSPQWSLSFRFPHQNLVHNSPFLHTCHMSRLFQSSRLMIGNNHTFIWINIPEVCLEEMRKITKNVRVTGLRGEIWSPHLHIMKQQCYLLDRDVWLEGCNRVIFRSISHHWSEKNHEKSDSE